MNDYDHSREYGTGYLPGPAGKDGAFALRTLLAGINTENFPMDKYYQAGATVDIEGRPWSVAAAWEDFLVANPVPTPLDTEFVSDLHVQAGLAMGRKNREAAEQQGITLESVAALLKDRGYIGAYWWAWDFADLAYWLFAGKGTGIIGIPWTEAMHRAAATRQEITTAHLNPPMLHHDGVALHVVGVSDRRGAFRIKMPWGERFGDKGRAWLTYEALRGLLGHDDTRIVTAVQTSKERP